MMRDNIKSIIKNTFSPGQLAALKRFWYLFKSLMIAPFCAGNIDRLAIVYGTDKCGAHHYTQHYQKHFNRLRKKALTILEIGVGGYEDPRAGGASLRMWKKYFPKSKIYSIDIYDKSPLQERRIKIFKGSQIDKSFLEEVCKKTGPLDIVIDDGSHVNSHVITSFKILFPYIKDGGIYVCEDAQTSYWPKLSEKEVYGGDSDNLNNTDTIIGFFKSLVDGINHKEFLIPGYKPTYFDQHIVSIHFYHNMVFVYKGLNNENSNKLSNGIPIPV